MGTRPALPDASNYVEQLRASPDSDETLRLLRLVLTQGDISKATGASMRQVRNWDRVGPIRRRQRFEDRIGYLAEVVATLAEDHSPAGIRQWLRAFNRNLTGRPIEEIADDPEGRVLWVAQHTVV